MSIEFTGERVIPGQVDQDLWNEHIARYAFAARFCGDRRVLDAGCGTGYGAHAIASEASAVYGIDVAKPAVSYAAAEYALPRLHWLQSSCTALPFHDRAFDVVIAFEVIEHLRDWDRLITEARRVLAPQGVFIVSTPNKRFYAESREESGPNPFHEHEFELHEFRGALESAFSHVSILLENHGECIVFESQPGAADAKLEGQSDPEEANFYIAVCSDEPVRLPSFVYVPRAANLLKERWLHIRRLEDELRTKNEWLAKAQKEHAELVELHSRQTSELTASNRWAQDLDSKLKAASERIVQLQNELETQQHQLKAQLKEATESVHNLEQQLIARTNELQRQVSELGKCVELLDTAEATVIERTNWAQSLQRDLEAARAHLDLLRASRWMKLGRMFKLGPELPG